MITTWKNSWEDFTPVLKFLAPISKLVYTTDAIESGFREWAAGERVMVR